MPEARWFGVALGVMACLFLSWGIDAEWRQMIIHCESRWLIDLVHDRAYSIGQSMDQALRTFLGDAMSQPRGSFAEGLVMGLRQLLTRISALGPLWPLLLLVASGFWYEARALRALAAQRFVYISPLRYRRIAGLPWVYLMLAMAGWMAPVPVHPLGLATLLLSAIGATAARYVRYMKQS